MLCKGRGPGKGQIGLAHKCNWLRNKHVNNADVIFFNFPADSHQLKNKNKMPSGYRN